jgi:glycosyltransferase involved in cell wall biosynthesis
MSTVAIVLCNYNHGKYLPESLGHLCRQTRPADQIIVLDDGSTDDSRDIIQRFASEHPRIEAHANGRNLGLQVSIAKAAVMVRCDYMLWTAADDLIRPAFVERNMAVLDRFPQAALSFSEVVSFTDDPERTDRFAVNPSVSRIFDLSDLPAYLSPPRLRQRMRRAYLPIASNTAVISVRLLREFGGFPPALRWFSDSFTCTALAARHGACVVAEPLALIRSAPASYSQSMHDAAQQIVVLNAMLDLLARPELRDVRALMKDCPSNLTVYDPLITRLLARRPRDWDILVAYAAWKLRARRDEAKVGWPRFVAGGGLRLARKMAASAARRDN